MPRRELALIRGLCFPPRSGGPRSKAFGLQRGKQKGENFCLPRRETKFLLRGPPSLFRRRISFFASQKEFLNRCQAPKRGGRKPASLLTYKAKIKIWHNFKQKENDIPTFCRMLECQSKPKSRKFSR